MSDLKNEKLLTARGIVSEALPSTLFRVQIEDSERKSLVSYGAGKSGNEIEDKKEILAYLSGKMRMHRIKVLIGDSVEVVLDPYGGKGRITKRL
jgi:translation initiation factor IF-1